MPHQYAKYRERKTVAWILLPYWCTTIFNRGYKWGAIVHSYFVVFQLFVGNKIIWCGEYISVVRMAQSRPSDCRNLPMPCINLAPIYSSYSVYTMYSLSYLGYVAYFRFARSPFARPSFDDSNLWQPRPFRLFEFSPVLLPSFCIKDLETLMRIATSESAL